MIASAIASAFSSSRIGPVEIEQLGRRTTRFTDSAPACMRSGSFRPVSGLPVGEVLGNSGAREPLTQQTGKEQQRAAWPVTRHDVLGLPGGVIGDQDDTADRLAVDLSYVV